MFRKRTPFPDQFGVTGPRKLDSVVKKHVVGSEEAEERLYTIVAHWNHYG